MKIDRLVSIIMILLDKKRISAQELADMFEVSPRTIYRDIDAINMAGIPVRGASGVGGGFPVFPIWCGGMNWYMLLQRSGVSSPPTGRRTLN